DIIVLASPSISLPRNASQFAFDGGDKIAVTKSVAVGTLDYAATTLTKFMAALQVSPVADWGSTYVVPIGQNTPGDMSMFDYTGLSIMASKDNTTIKIDIDGN